MGRVQPSRQVVSGTPGLYRTQRVAGDVYEFRVGKRWIRVPGLPTVTEAKRWRNQYLGLNENERVVPTQVRFLEYANEWIATSPTLKPRTRRLYESQVRLHLVALHKLRLHEIGVDVLRAVIGRMQNAGLSPNTIRNVLVAGSAVLSAAVDDKLIIVNPIGQLNKKQRPKVRKGRKRILKPAEAARLIACCSDSVMPVAAVMLFAGLRISEAIGLTWGDVDLAGRKLHVWRQLAYAKEDVTIGEYWTELKGEEGDVKERDVEVSEVLRSILIAHRGDRITHRKDLVFTTANATPYSQRNTQRQFKLATVAAGFADVPKMTPHQCRHNFASALIASGADPVFVADQLGHADPNVTLGIYAHEFKAARESGSAAAAIDAIYGAAMA